MRRLKNLNRIWSWKRKSFWQNLNQSKTNSKVFERNWLSLKKTKKVTNKKNIFFIPLLVRLCKNGKAHSRCEGNISMLKKNLCIHHPHGSRPPMRWGGTTMPNLQSLPQLWTLRKIYLCFQFIWDNFIYVFFFMNIYTLSFLSYENFYFSYYWFIIF